MHNLFTGKQVALFVTGCIIITLGYILLAQGPVDNPLSLSWAPFLLVGGYCILIPVAIILKDKERIKTK
ncbi:MAG: hypothetical protein JW913_02580 [Chitinispirillaceae bacterium]|nr:hypothetical protein [Chitinispirillaceae bacterium]